jgi:hypothetical protein
MILQAEINKEGTLNPSIPKFFWGKKVTISINEEIESETSNWKEISAALEKVDALELPRRTHDEILAELRAFKETE